MKIHKSLEKSIPVTRETQTLIEDDDISIPCKLCVYETNSEMDLRIHMEYAHDIDFDYDEVKIQCRICNNKFKSKKDLMMHVKSDHTESLPTCRYFQSGTCKFNKESCWFRHDKKEDTEIKCRYCSQYFETKCDVMIHQKQNHEGTVQICKNYLHKQCKYRSKCWFLHFDYKGENQCANTSEKSTFSEEDSASSVKDDLNPNK